MTQRIQPGDVCIVVRVPKSSLIEEPGIWAHLLGRPVKVVQTAYCFVSRESVWLTSEEFHIPGHEWVRTGFLESELQPLPRLREDDEVTASKDLAVPA